MDNQRLKKQLDFLLEADKMKSLYRQTYIIADEKRSDSMPSADDGSPVHRRENDAEHSFHLALFAMVLAEYSNQPLDVLKVMKMVLIHDIVEIDAGDTYCYDEKGRMTQRAREEKAADRLFGILPKDLCDEYRGLWEEFDRMDTPESRFAAALDRLQPMLLNFTKGGVSWQEHRVDFDQVYSRNSHIANGSETLWEFAKDMLDTARDRGYFDYGED